MDLAIRCCGKSCCHTKILLCGNGASARLPHENFIVWQTEMKLEIHRHSPVSHAAYADLVSLLLDDVMADIKGMPTARERAGRTYWYDRYRIGDAIQERYLGEDSSELRSRIERHDALKEK